MKIRNKIDNSRRKTPWDDNASLTATQKFIKIKYEENYCFKHPNLLLTKEFELLNSIKIDECRRCGTKSIRKKGFSRNNVQRYYCNECERHFEPTTNTIFEEHKISITEWIEFLLDLFNYGSTSLVSKVNKNCINTSRYWLTKTFLVLKDYQQSILLKGTVYVDEFYYKVIQSKIITKDGKQLRGLSKKQFCIGLGYDKENIIAILEGVGKPSENKTKLAFIDYIKTNSKLIHDEEKSHKVLIDELNLTDESYNSNDLKKLDDKNNPLQPINHICDLLRKFLNSHSGFDRDNLQDYLNLFCFMHNGYKSNLERIDKLLNIVLNKKVRLKYREMFKKRDND